MLPFHYTVTVFVMGYQRIKFNDFNFSISLSFYFGDPVHQIQKIIRMRSAALTSAAHEHVAGCGHMCPMDAVSTEISKALLSVWCQDAL